MRKYLIAWIMVHIGMILIQGERTFIIFFSNVSRLCFVSASRSGKRKKKKTISMERGMRRRSFFMRDRNQIKTKKELSSQLFIFSFKEHTRTHTKN